MGLFDTPYEINQKLIQLKELKNEDFNIDVNIINENLFYVKHDYFQSPCYFTVINWNKTPVEENIIFTVKKFPRDVNSMVETESEILSNKLLDVINQWDRDVNNIMKAESLYENPNLDKMQQQFIEAFGLTEENANELLDDIQKKHAAQYCDSVSEILSELKNQDYDESKIEEIKFDLDKIKRKIKDLKINTKGELANRIAKVFGKIKILNVGKYIAEKSSDGIASKFIGDLIDKIGEL